MGSKIHHHLVKSFIIMIVAVGIFSNANIFGQTYNILPLGNSITQADNSNFSYRYYLWTKLIDDGVNFNFVGSITNNFGGNPSWPMYMGQTFDQDHDGHTGWRADQLVNGNTSFPAAGNLSTWLASYTPDIAMVHIGTNDLFASEHITNILDDLSDIIADLRNDNPNVIILMAQIIPSLDTKIDYRIPSYNSEISRLIFDEYTHSSPIILVDQFTGFNTITDLFDDIHPNATGEDKIAEQFRIAINHVINDEYPGVWTGNTSTDWLTASNWANNAVPLASDYVYIPSTASNWPVYSGNLTIGTDCKGIKLTGASSLSINGNLIINSGCRLICEDDASLGVQGSWINNGDFEEGNGTLSFTGSTNSSISKAGSSTGGGKINRSVSGFMWNLDKFNYMDCYEAFTLVSAKVYANGAGNRTFYWSTYGGPIVEQVTVMIPDGESRVSLNFSITPGTNHKLGVSGDPQLWRDKPDVAYPYHIGHVASLQSSVGGFDAYFFLYDLEYSLPSENFYDVNITNSAIFSTNCDSTIKIIGDVSMDPVSILTIETGNEIEISGNLMLNGDSSGTASLVDKGTLAVAGNTTVQNYYTGDSIDTLSHYHFIGSPLNGVVSNVFLDLYMKYWVESTYTWNNVTATDYSLIPGTGYVIWSTLGDVTVDYTGGNLNTGDISPGLTATDVNNDGFGNEDGWNLVSNPYPSAIDVGTENDPVSGYTWTNLDNAFYYWNGSQYAVFTRTGNGISINGGTRYIPAMQGFFVKANAFSPAMTIPNSARMHSGQTNYKSKDINSEFIKLRIEGNSYSDELVILTHLEASLDFDKRFDAYKLDGIEEAPGIFSILPDANLAINTLPEINENTQINLGCKVKKSGIYTLELNELSGFTDAQEIYLKDTHTNTVTNFKEAKLYHFNAKPADDINRFVLQFSKTEDMPESNNNSVVVYSENNAILIGLNQEGNTEIAIFDITGKQLINKTVSGSGMYSIPLSIGAGCYIVKVVNNGNITSKKVFVR